MSKVNEGGFPSVVNDEALNLPMRGSGGEQDLPPLERERT